MDKHDYLFTSESVTEGHPDKIADQISDAILDAALTDDRTAASPARPRHHRPRRGRRRDHARRPTSTSPRSCARPSRTSATDTPPIGFDYETCGVITTIHEQSPDIAQGVDEASRCAPT